MQTLLHEIMLSNSDIDNLFPLWIERYFWYITILSWTFNGFYHSCISGNFWFFLIVTAWNMHSDSLGRGSQLPIVTKEAKKYAVSDSAAEWRIFDCRPCASSVLSVKNSADIHNFLLRYELTALFHMGDLQQSYWNLMHLAKHVI